ncbi:hypothetical protein OS493_028876 [Desmophyllum pertusum]|uniref:Uncharacterized protein n=1 Tax=Desmophyllum pertusum TaxID=174260 RepID=A0A9W9ZLW1_9CNID|nr:hypothetical protein OS493_028876 [Desmophyllum pertusum]
MFSSRTFRTRLPVGVIPRQLDFEELYQRDLDKKMQMKVTDNKKVVKKSDIQMGGTVLVKQDARRKANPLFEEEPLKVQYRKGSQVVAKRKDGSTITRTTAQFKKVPYQSNGETGRSTAAAETDLHETDAPTLDPAESQNEDLPNRVQQLNADHTHCRGVTGFHLIAQLNQINRLSQRKQADRVRGCKGARASTSETISPPLLTALAPDSTEDETIGLDGGIAVPFTTLIVWCFHPQPFT